MKTEHCPPKKRRLPAGFLLSAICVLPAWTADYYVSATGNDVNSGSISSPWQTVGKVNSGLYGPGDTISFHGGDTFSGTTLSFLCVGSAGNPITIKSYGTGQATIDVSNATPGIYHGISLTNPQNCTITNLKLTASGWTGSGTSAVVLNGGYGIYVVSTGTSGLQLQNITVTSNTISGFWNAMWFDAGKTTGNCATVGFNNVTLSHNTMDSNIGGGILLQGCNADAGGSVTTNSNIHMDWNSLTNMPGDPNSGAGGVHGSIKTEAYALVLNNVTGYSMDHNYANGIAGYGGALSGLTFGGSSALQVGNARNGTQNHNEISGTRCSTHFDGSAIDFDQDTQNAEASDNLTYNNVGPSIQFGSFGGKITSGLRIHHNISFNDARGNNTGGVSEQGVFRIWGNTNSNAIFENTVYLNQAGTVGVPSTVNFEVGNNSNLKVLNNIFQTTGSLPMVWANRTWNATHIGTTQSFLGNVYDSSGSSLLISNDTGTAYVNVTSLSAWRGLGFEVLSATNYGSAGASLLLNLAGFSPPAGGFFGNNIALETIDNFDLTPASSAVALGIDPALVSVVLDPVDFRGNPAQRGNLFDTGAVSFFVPSASVRGGAARRGNTVQR